MIKVIAGIIIKDGKILIARRATHKSMAGKWEFPGGKIEDNETREEALERELFEEFGVITKTGDYVASNLHDYCTFQIELLAYFSIYIEGEYNLTDHDKIEWVYLYEIGCYDLAEADVPILKYLLNAL